MDTLPNQPKRFLGLKYVARTRARSRQNNLHIYVVPTQKTTKVLKGIGNKKCPPFLNGFVYFQVKDVSATGPKDGKPYFIHYHGWNKNWDEWVSECSMPPYWRRFLKKGAKLRYRFSVRLDRPMYREDAIAIILVPDHVDWLPCLALAEITTCTATEPGLF